MCNCPGFLRDSKLNQSTIGILFPGEMGSTFGKLLAGSGFRVVTTLEGRSLRTQRLCHDAGLGVLDSVGRVLECADIVMSFVPPGAALQVAGNVAVLVKGESRRLRYVDGNSISPVTAVKISELLRPEHVDFVDASIRGLASELRRAGVLYLSGARAEELSGQFGSIMRVKVVGDAPGQASALKMVLSCLPKGLIGLFSETMLFAREMGLLNEAMEICNEFYPGVMEVVKRMLPTYPQHAARRSEELQELEETMWLNGVPPRVLGAVREVTSNLAEVDWPKNAEYHRWAITEIIEEIYRNHLLNASRRPSTAGEVVARQSL
jgi:3-hydroxyisobutyrate dehydrogenase-like beta-hydroxyacid dehydrogenase